MAEYDFIVVGTGAGGCVMANRLTENPDVSVLALEAGGAEVPEIVHNAADWPKIWGTEWDWSYKSTPQAARNDRPIRSGYDAAPCMTTTSVQRLN